MNAYLYTWVEEYTCRYMNVYKLVDFCSRNRPSLHRAHGRVDDWATEPVAGQSRTGCPLERSGSVPPFAERLDGQRSKVAENLVGGGGRYLELGDGSRELSSDDVSVLG